MRNSKIYTKKASRTESEGKDKSEARKISHLARKATSESFGKAIHSNIVLYKEKDTLIERYPTGETKTLGKLSSQKTTLKTRFKMK